MTTDAGTEGNKYLLLASLICAGIGGWMIGYTPGWTAIVGGLFLLLAGMLGAPR